MTWRCECGAVTDSADTRALSHTPHCPIFAGKPVSVTRDAVRDAGTIDAEWADAADAYIRQHAIPCDEPGCGGWATGYVDTAYAPAYCDAHAVGREGWQELESGPATRTILALVTRARGR